MRTIAALPAAVLATALAAGCAAPRSVPSLPERGVLDLRTGRTVTFEEMVEDLRGATVVYVGEHHDHPEHHEIQLWILAALSTTNPRTMLGMEMLQRPYQPILDRWSAGEMTEAEFLREGQWYEQWSDWNLYGPILRLARDRRLRVVGLNLDRSYIRAIGAAGLGSLSPFLRGQLPAVIDTSVASHRKAIREVFAGHPGAAVDEDRFRRFYEAQCTWDEVMAETAAEALKEALPGSAMVLLAGAMHVKDFHAIPDRLRRRLPVEDRVVLPVVRGSDPPNGYIVGMGRIADYLVPTGPSPGATGARFGVSLRSGSAEVVAVTPGGAAEGAGLRPGDVLLSVDDRPVADLVDLRLAVEGRRAGEAVRFRWTRGGAPGEGTGTLTVPPAAIPPAVPAPPEKK
jgi:uncharacterized iron-regulated protein